MYFNVSILILNKTIRLANSLNTLRLPPSLRDEIRNLNLCKLKGAAKLELTAELTRAHHPLASLKICGPYPSASMLH
jgi:hypothetical protein